MIWHLIQGQNILYEVLEHLNWNEFQTTQTIIRFTLDITHEI